MTTHHDWRDEIERHAAATGAHLPPAIVEELAEHLEDLHAAALRDGVGPDDARARARSALEESALEMLRRPAARRAPPPPAVPATGRSLNILGALRLAVRQLQQRPGFAAVTISCSPSASAPAPPCSRSSIRCCSELDPVERLRAE